MKRPLPITILCIAVIFITFAWSIGLLSLKNHSDLYQTIVGDPHKNVLHPWEQWFLNPVNILVPFFILQGKPWGRLMLIGGNILLFICFISANFNVEHTPLFFANIVYGLSLILIPSLVLFTKSSNEYFSAMSANQKPA